MNQLQKLKKEIQSALDYEKTCALIYASSINEADDNSKGWIEALEYCLEEIEKLEEK